MCMVMLRGVIQGRNGDRDERLSAPGINRARQCISRFMVRSRLHDSTYSSHIHCASQISQKNAKL